MSQGRTRGSAQWEQTDPSREMGHFVISQQTQSQAKKEKKNLEGGRGEGGSETQGEEQKVQKGQR